MGLNDLRGGWRRDESSLSPDTPWWHSAQLWFPSALPLRRLNPTAVKPVLSTKWPHVPAPHLPPPQAQNSQETLLCSPACVSSPWGWRGVLGGLCVNTGVAFCFPPRRLFKSQELGKIRFSHLVTRKAAEPVAILQTQEMPLMYVLGVEGVMEPQVGH